MKINTKKYAIALYESLEGKQDGEIEEVLTNFIKVLAVNNAMNKADDIVNKFYQVWNDRKGIVDINVTTAKGMDDETLKEVKKYITELLNIKEVVLNQKIDKEIIGGVVISYQDTILDGSVRTILKELNNKLVK